MLRWKQSGWELIRRRLCRRPSEAPGATGQPGARLSALGYHCRALGCTTAAGLASRLCDCVRSRRTNGLALPSSAQSAVPMRAVSKLQKMCRFVFTPKARASIAALAGAAGCAGAGQGASQGESPRVARWSNADDGARGWLATRRRSAHSAGPGRWRAVPPPQWRTPNIPAEAGGPHWRSRRRKSCAGEKWAAPGAPPLPGSCPSWWL